MTFFERNFKDFLKADFIKIQWAKELVNKILALFIRVVIINVVHRLENFEPELMDNISDNK